MWRSFIAGLLLWPAISMATGIGAYTELDAWSEPVPVAQMLDGWRTRGEGQYAQGRWLAGIYVAQAGWQLGWFERKDYHLNFSRNTARFYALLENQQLPEGTYPLDLEVNTLESRGVRATYFIPLSFGELKVGASLLRPYATHQGSLTGLGEVNASGQQSFEYNIDYRFSRNALLEQNADNVRGFGHALDMHLNMPLAGGTVTLDADDVFYRVYWQQIGRSQGCIYQNRLVLTVCQQNYVQDSEYSGQQVLPGKYQLAYRYPLVNSVALAMRVNVWGYYHDISPEVHLAQWQFGYGLQKGLATLGYTARQFTLQAGLDAGAVHTAKQWHLACDWNMDL